MHQNWDPLKKKVSHQNGDPFKKRFHIKMETHKTKVCIKMGTHKSKVCINMGTHKTRPGNLQINFDAPGQIAKWVVYLVPDLLVVGSVLKAIFTPSYKKNFEHIVTIILLSLYLFVTNLTCNINLFLLPKKNYFKLRSSYKACRLFSTVCT